MLINEVSPILGKEDFLNLKLSDFSIGEQKDLILNLCLKHPKSRLESADIKRILFPNDSSEDIKYILILISENNPEVVEFIKTVFDLCLKTNERTKVFIENGGFTKQEKEEKIFLIKKLEKENIELKKSKVDLELAEKILKEYPKTKLFSRIGAFIGIGLAILELIKWIMKLMSPSGKT